MYHHFTQVEMTICPMCASNFSNLTMLLKHIWLTHTNTNDFQQQCNLQGCKRTFRNFKTYCNHVYMWHDTTQLETAKVEESAGTSRSEFLLDDNRIEKTMTPCLQRHLISLKRYPRHQLCGFCINIHQTFAL